MKSFKEMLESKNYYQEIEDGLIGDLIKANASKGAKRPWVEKRLKRELPKTISSSDFKKVVDRVMERIDIMNGVKYSSVGNV